MFLTRAQNVFRQNSEKNIFYFRGKTLSIVNVSWFVHLQKTSLGNSVSTKLFTVYLQFFALQSLTLPRVVSPQLLEFFVSLSLLIFASQLEPQQRHPESLSLLLRFLLHWRLMYYKNNEYTK